MEKSALQIARAAYQPKLPKALQGPVKAVEGAATQLYERLSQYFAILERNKYIVFEE